jgi:hypothetical protein
MTTKTESPFVLENFVQYELSPSERDTLLRMGMICQSEDSDRPGTLLPDHYELTAFVWEELGLQGSEDVAFDLFDRILGRKTES